MQKMAFYTIFLKCLDYIDITSVSNLLDCSSTVRKMIFYYICGDGLFIEKNIGVYLKFVSILLMDKKETAYLSTIRTLLYETKKLDHPVDKADYVNTLLMDVLTEYDVNDTLVMIRKKIIHTFSARSCSTTLKNMVNSLIIMSIILHWPEIHPTEETEDVLALHALSKFELVTTEPKKAFYERSFSTIFVSKKSTIFHVFCFFMVTTYRPLLKRMLMYTWHTQAYKNTFPLLWKALTVSEQQDVLCDNMIIGKIGLPAVEKLEHVWHDTRVHNEYAARWIGNLWRSYNRTTHLKSMRSILRLVKNGHGRPVFSERIRHLTKMSLPEFQYFIDSS